MAPRPPKLATDAASQFPSFDELAAEARKKTPETPYLLPIKGDVYEITLDADRFLTITRAQLIGDYESMYEALFPDNTKRAIVRASFIGAPPTVVDALVGNVLSYYYGHGLQIEAEQGNSSAS